MRYSQYLLQEDRSKVLSYNDCVDLLDKNCKSAIKEYFNDNIIYRGIKNIKPYLYIDPKKYSRSSANTTNYYTLINDNSPYWKKYPKRSQSIICATAEMLSKEYGSLYIVLPYDGAKIGVCPDTDYWYSFDVNSNIYSMDYFNDTLENIFDSINIPLHDDSYKNIVKSFEAFDKQYKNDISSNDDLMKSLLKDYKGNLLDQLQKLLSPNKNDFELKKIGDDLPYNKEVWTDGKSILINRLYLDILDIFKDKK